MASKPELLLGSWSLARGSDSAVFLHDYITGQHHTFSEIPCPHCGKPIRLKPFTINADWRQVAKAWGMKDIPGEKGMGDMSKMDASSQKSEKSAVNGRGKAEEKDMKPWWKFWT